MPETPDPMTPALTTPRPDDTPVHFFSRVYRWAWVVTLVGAVIFSVSGSPVLALNFAAGVGLSMALVRVTQILVLRYLAPGGLGRRQRATLMALVLVKLPVVVVICGLMVSSSWFQPIGFILGVSVTPGLIVYGGLKTLTA